MRVDAYMQVSQLYKANKPKGSTKKTTVTATDSLEISGFGKDSYKMGIDLLEEIL